MYRWFASRHALQPCHISSTEVVIGHLKTVCSCQPERSASKTVWPKALMGAKSKDPENTSILNDVSMRSHEILESLGLLNIENSEKKIREHSRKFAAKTIRKFRSLCVPSCPLWLKVLTHPTTSATSPFSLVVFRPRTPVRRSAPEILRHE